VLLDLFFDIVAILHRVYLDLVALIRVAATFSVIDRFSYPSDNGQGSWALTMNIFGMFSPICLVGIEAEKLQGILAQRQRRAEGFPSYGGDVKIHELEGCPAVYGIDRDLELRVGNLPQ
jgi:hypothetical protein